MNSLYTTGVRQTTSLQADLERLRNGDTSAALLGEYHNDQTVLRSRELTAEGFLP